MDDKRSTRQVITHQREVEETDVEKTHVIERLQKPEGQPSGEWLLDMSPDQLYLAVMSLILELQSRVGVPREIKTDTDTLIVSPHPFSAERKDLKLATGQFLPLPHGVEPDEDRISWRFILISSNPEHRLLGLEVRDDVLVGRPGGPSRQADLDLTPYDGEKLGVSRRHALLRSTANNLFIIDQHSTNGTYWNQVRLRPGVPQELDDEDMISFGNLHFKIMFVSHPPRLVRDTPAANQRPIPKPPVSHVNKQR